MMVHKLTADLKSSEFVIGLLEDVINLTTISPTVINSTTISPTQTMNEWEIQCKAASKHQTDGDSFTEMKLNINELQEFCHMSTRPYIKEILQNLINKLSMDIVQMKNNLVNGSKIKLKWSVVVDNDKWQNQPFRIPTTTTSQTVLRNKTIKQTGKHETTTQPMKIKSGNE
jgi:hypothetical protein